MSDWGAIERIPAVVTMAEGVALEGELHVQARVPYREGAETPLELLNRAEEFFALSSPERGVVFLSKDQVAVVACAPPFDAADPDRVSAARRIGFAVTLAGGTEYSGWATPELPPTRARTLDYLNTAERFFSIQSDDATRYVNRALVRLVRPLD
jgi:hypothetical protein